MIANLPESDFDISIKDSNSDELDIYIDYQDDFQDNELIIYLEEKRANKRVYKIH